MLQNTVTTVSSSAPFFRTRMPCCQYENAMAVWNSCLGGVASANLAGYHLEAGQGVNPPRRAVGTSGERFLWRSSLLFTKRK